MTRARAVVQATVQEEPPGSSARACLRFTLPVPPSVNRYRIPVRSRIVLSDEGRAFKRAVREHAALVSMLEGHVALHIVIYFPNRRSDLDNALKVLLDSLQGVAYQNDAQVVTIRAFKGLSRERPRAEVTVTPVPA